MKESIIVLICILCISGDIVKLKNGGSVEGKVIKQNQEFITIEAGKIQTEIETSEIDTIIQKTFTPTNTKRKELKEIKVFMKGNTVIIEKNEYNLCKDLKSLKNDLFKLSQEHVGLIPVANPSQTFIQFYPLMKFCYYYAGTNHFVEYKDKRYCFLNPNNSNRELSGKKLHHMIFISDSILREVSAISSEQRCKFKFKEKHLSKPFFDGVEETKKKNKHCIDAEEIMIAVHKDTKISILFSIVSEFNQRYIDNILLALFRKDEDQFPNCYNVLQNSPYFQSSSARTHKVSIYGSRTKENVQKIVKNKIPKLIYIYNQRLKRYPNFKVKLIAKFSIAQDGNVTQCKITSSTKSVPLFEEKIKNAILSWKFKKIYNYEDTTDIVYPFVFSPHDNSTETQFPSNLY